MTDMFFNARGSTHSLRLLHKPDDDVWEALIDGSEYYHFEAPEDAEVWELFSLAIDAYMGYVGDAGTRRIDWGGKDGPANWDTYPARTEGTERNPASGCGCS
jgi:hypothetical protein